MPEARDISPEERISADVARNGWSCLNIRDGRPPFAYSVGLTFTFGHPELVVFGLREENPGLLKVLVSHLRKGRRFSAGTRHDDLLAGVPLFVQDVHPAWHPRFLGYAMGYCREQGRPGELEALQVFWPDKQGKFPHDGDCDPAWARAQPLLRLPPRTT